jgi:signal transduction histidine kinase
MGHDIRNPLNVISLVLRLLTPRVGADPKSAAHVQRCLSSMAQALRIIDSLYEFACAGAHPQAGAHADVLAVLSDAISNVRPLAEQAGIELRVEPVTGDGPPVQAACSPGILTCVMTHLLRNAVKYMDDSPVRTVAARVARLPGWVRVEIEDTGAGIPAELHHSIFEPYVLTKGHSKSGIGLATVERIVQRHAGRLGVRSAPGQGSLFWFELPIAAP